MKNKILLILITIIALSSCKVYKQHFMFQSEKSILKSDSSLFEYSENNYKLQINDYFEFEVYSNNGEILVDPNYDYISEVLGDKSINPQMMNSMGGSKYVVAIDGTSKFPMIGWMPTAGKSVFELESELQKLYSEFYVDAFVQLKPLNRRVVVFRSTGGVVVPLQNENMSILEVIALSGEVTTSSNITDIKVIRGDLKDPEMLKIDLSTMEGLKNANMMVRANDVIYIQPKRFKIRDVNQDIAPIIALTSSILSLTLTILFNIK